MTILNAFKTAKKMLTENSLESADFEVSCLIEGLYGISKTARMINSQAEIDETKLIDALKRRIKGEPLQYILGEWEFMGLSFFVGEGVLIPRPETEILVNLAVERLQTIQNPIVFDLCAGSGCIGLSVAKLVPASKVILFEKSEEAFKYLEKNAKEFNLQNVTIMKCDILEDNVSLQEPFAILSNPPYIETNEIQSLQKEVQKEPKMALDGGEDGLLFYRAIAEKWLSKIQNGGFIAVECGENQATDIAKMFSQKSKCIQVIKDFNNIERVVLGEF